MLPSVEVVDVAVSSSGIREKKEIERRAAEHEGGGGSIVVVVVVALKKHQLYPLFVAFSDVLYGLAWPF